MKSTGGIEVHPVMKANVMISALIIFIVEHSLAEKSLESRTQPRQIPSLTELLDGIITLGEQWIENYRSGTKCHIVGIR